MELKTRDWRIPIAWLTLCVVWSSTWLVIKIGLRDLPPVSFVALRFVVAILVLLAISVGRARLLPPSRADYLVLAGTGLLMFGLNYTLLFWAACARFIGARGSSSKRRSRSSA
jgi:drug/metabolite transporter (DMT)-like permease